MMTIDTGVILATVGLEIIIVIVERFFNYFN